MDIEEELRVNIKYAQKPSGKWRDTDRRSRHILSRMALRGIGLEQIKEAVQRGAKRLQEDGRIIIDYRWFRLVYREFRFKNIRKVYPITVHEQ